MNQLDMICGQCPVEGGCDEGSLFCAYRWATEPNDAQKALLTTLAIERSKLRRKEFDAKHYQQNRDKKLAAANLRHAQQRTAGGRGL